VGEWLPSAKRFPGGIREVLDLIRAKGMVPGLWLELEVMGINCPLAKRVPDDWFFSRHGRRVIDNARYQLDFRTPAVRAHADAVIDRVVKEYGAGYIKMDYNINAGTGTDRAADSAGDGLLEHQRAYLAWLDGVFARHPELVIENCGSGGLRMDYAMLARCSIQSTSDQTDYRLYPYISAACATAVAPEQAAIWSYPLKNGDVDEVVVNMVNALLGRIHQSGHLAELSSERLAAVREGIAAYKALRGDIPVSDPFWPQGLPRWGAGWAAHGLRGPQRTHVAVWRLEGEDPVIELPIPHLAGKAVRVVTAYPVSAEGGTVWSSGRGVLTVRQPRRNTARVLTLTAE
jgi:alpha-galactosidase